MQKSFSHSFSSNIWRIIPDQNPDNNRWAIELREISEKKVSFAVLDLASGALLWQNSPEGTDWWSSLTAFASGNLYIHNYRYPELPQPTDLIAVLAEGGQFLWMLPDYLLVRALNSTEIEVSTKQDDAFKNMRCDARSGQLLGESSRYEQDEAGIILAESVRYKHGNSYFEKLASFVSEMTDGHQPVSIDYLEKRPYMMFSYYIYEQGKVIQYLLVVTDQKKIVHHQQLSEERDGMGRATMMLRKSTLVYLKNTNEFSSLTLSN